MYKLSCVKFVNTRKYSLHYSSQSPALGVLHYEVAVITLSRHFVLFVELALWSLFQFYWADTLHPRGFAYKYGFFAWNIRTTKQRCRNFYFSDVLVVRMVNYIATLVFWLVYRPRRSRPTLAIMRTRNPTYIKMQIKSFCNLRYSNNFWHCQTHAPFGQFSP